jgi:hypothetical protein
MARWQMGQGHFLVPGLTELLQYRVLVATCTMAAKLHHIGVKRCVATLGDLDSVVVRCRGSGGRTIRVESDHTRVLESLQQK